MPVFGAAAFERGMRRARGLARDRLYDPQTRRLHLLSVGEESANILRLASTASSLPPDKARALLGGWLGKLKLLSPSDPQAAVMYDAALEPEPAVLLCEALLRAGLAQPAALLAERAWAHTRRLEELHAREPVPVATLSPGTDESAAAAAQALLEAAEDERLAREAFKRQLREARACALLAWERSVEQGQLALVQLLAESAAESAAYASAQRAAQGVGGSGVNMQTLRQLQSLSPGLAAARRAELQELGALQLKRLTARLVCGADDVQVRHHRARVGEIQSRILMMLTRRAANAKPRQRERRSEPTPGTHLPAASPAIPGPSPAWLRSPALPPTITLLLSPSAAATSPRERGRRWVLRGRSRAALRTLALSTLLP